MRRASSSQLLDSQERERSEAGVLGRTRIRCGTRGTQNRLPVQSLGEPLGIMADMASSSITLLIREKGAVRRSLGSSTEPEYLHKNLQKTPRTSFRPRKGQKRLLPAFVRNPNERHLRDIGYPTIYPTYQRENLGLTEN